MPETTRQHWDWQIRPRAGWWDTAPKEWWRYRHLLSRLIRREFLLNYQQTILGPAWMFIQPILTLIIYLLVFGKIIGVDTGNVPPVLFYLSGIILWNFFNDVFLASAFTFLQNVHLFSKVYFPRIIVPLSALLTQALRFLIQFALLAAVMIWFAVRKDAAYGIGLNWLLLPLLILGFGILSFAIGLLVSVLTARYRDLANMVHIGLRLLMFITPVFYPASVIPLKYRWLVDWNPLGPYFEWFRLLLFGQGHVTPVQAAYAIGFTLVALIVSFGLFQRQGDKIMDII